MTETKYCPRCYTSVVISDWMPNKARSDGISSYCRACHNKITKAGRQKQRRQLFEDLGGICVRCGFSDERALQIDHVNGGGTAQRKGGLNSSTAAFYKEVLAKPDEYQLLCANCNWIKRAENGEAMGANKRNPQRPSADRECSPGIHTPESDARRSASLQEYLSKNPEAEQRRRDKGRRTRKAFSPEQKAEISRKISAARTGTRKGPDGKWCRSD